MWKGIAVALAVAVAIPSIATSAVAQERREEHERHERGEARGVQDHDQRGAPGVRDERAYQGQRRDLDRRQAPRAFEHREDRRWAFDRDHGWRFESQPGIWSPYYVYWAVGNSVQLGPPPTVTVVRHPYGEYVLQGDGVTVPYYWAWVGTASAMAPPPPVPYSAVPDGAAELPPPPPPPPAG